MKGRTIGLACAMVLLAAPALAQSRMEMEREREMERRHQMQREQMQRDQQMRRETQAQRSMQTPTHTPVTVEELRDQYAEVADRRENRATKLNAEDYRELAKQREELNRLIDRMEAGGEVGAGDVDRALGIDRVF